MAYTLFDTYQIKGQLRGGSGVRQDSQRCTFCRHSPLKRARIFMPRIEKRVTPEQKEAWQAFCKAQGLGESEMLGLVLEKVTAGQVDTGFKGSEGPRSGQIKITLKPNEIEQMTARAKEEGFPSRTTWLTRLVLNTLNKTPALTECETNVLRESNRELLAIGRNLNQIVRVLNKDNRESDKITKQVIERLSPVQEAKFYKKALLTNCFDIVKYK